MSFENSYILWLIPLAITFFVIFFNYVNKTTIDLLKKFASEKLFSKLLANHDQKKRLTKQIFVILAVIFLLIAIARPQFGYRWEKCQSKGIDIMFAIDTSKSMLAKDVHPNRLERSKLAILDFISQLKGDRVGLIAFAGDSFLQCPLTLDYEAFQLSLNAIEVGIIGKGGTNLSSAIETAEAAFSSETNYKILILMTDGEDLTGTVLQTAKNSSEHGTVIYTVGIGEKNGELIPIGENTFLKDSDGNFVKTSLNEKDLMEIAKITNGLYSHLNFGNTSLHEINHAIEKKFPKNVINSHVEKVKTERFQIPLIFALILLCFEWIISVRKRKNFQKTRNFFSKNKKRALLLFLLCYQNVIFAENLSEKEQKVKNIPKQSLKTIQEKFLKRFPVLQNSANRFYKNGKFKESAELYEKQLKKHPKDDSLKYNFASALYKDSEQNLLKILPENEKNQFDKNQFETQSKIFQEQLQKPEKMFSELLKTNDLKLQEKIYHNLGNLYYRLGQLETDNKQIIEKWQKSLQFYKNSLDLNAENQETKHNYEYVKKKLEELNKQNQNQNQNQQNQDQNKQENNENKDDQKKENQSNKNQENKNDQKNDKKENNNNQSDNKKDDDNKKENSDKQNDQKNDQNQNKENQNDQKNKPEESKQNQDKQNSSDQKKSEQNDKKQDSQGSNQSQNQNSQEKDQDDSREKENNLGQKKNDSERKENNSEQKKNFGGHENRPQNGNLTKEEAEKMLNRMKGEEKNLPLRLGQPKNKKEDILKDW